MVDLAIGVIIGAAFGGIVIARSATWSCRSSATIGGLDFSNYFVHRPSKDVTATNLADAKKAGRSLGLGQFPHHVAINFLLLSPGRCSSSSKVSTSCAAKLPPSREAKAARHRRSRKSAGRDQGPDGEENLTAPCQAKSDPMPSRSDRRPARSGARSAGKRHRRDHELRPPARRRHAALGRRRRSADAGLHRRRCGAGTDSRRDTSTPGSAAFRNCARPWRAYHTAILAGPSQPSEFFVTGSGMQAIQIALAMTADAGNEVIIPTPAWPELRLPATRHCRRPSRRGAAAIRQWRLDIWKSNTSPRPSPTGRGSYRSSRRPIQPAGPRRTTNLTSAARACAQAQDSGSSPTKSIRGSGMARGRAHHPSSM